MILGVDLSHHKSGGSLASLKDQGYSFVILKASEGAGFVDPSFHTYLTQAMEHGLPVAAYHYVRVADSVERQIRLITQVVPLNVPVILDVERGSGQVPSMWLEMIKQLKQHGYVVPFVYIPHWYWVEIGQPNLGEFPALWASRYVTGRAYASELFRQVSANWWSGYGNNFVGMLQFTSTAVVDGLPKDIDVSAFVGSTQDLIDLFGMEEHVTGSEVWKEILTSSIGYKAPAEEWLLATSARVEDLKGEVEEFMVEVKAFMDEMRGKLSDVNGLTAEQVQQAFVAALPKLKVTGEFHGGTDTPVS